MSSPRWFPFSLCALQPAEVLVMLDWPLSQWDRNICIHTCHIHLHSFLFLFFQLKSLGSAITLAAPLGRANGVSERDVMSGVEQRAEDGSLIDLGWKSGGIACYHFHMWLLFLSSDCITPANPRVSHLFSSYLLSVSLHPVSTVFLSPFIYSFLHSPPLSSVLWRQTQAFRVSMKLSVLMIWFFDIYAYKVFIFKSFNLGHIVTMVTICISIYLDR